MDNSLPSIPAFIRQALHERDSRVLVDVFTLNALILWGLLYFSIESLQLIELVIILVLVALPFLLNHSPLVSAAVDVTVVLQLVVYAIVLLLVDQADWPVVVLMGGVFVVQMYLLYGAGMQSLALSILLLAWLPFSQFINPDVDPAFNAVFLMWVFTGVAGIFWLVISPLPAGEVPVEESRQQAGENNLPDLSRRIDNTARQLDEAAGTLHTITFQQSSRANQQAQVVEDVNQVIDNFQKLATQVRTKAEYLSSIAGKAVDVSETGKKTIASALTGMQATDEAMHTVGHTIGDLARNLRRIGEIIASVSDIATRSNFLALNAQIEAARAGEQGMGFAVVADQVRDLAEQSRQAAADVRRILREIQQSVVIAVDAAEAGTTSVNSGLEDASAVDEVITRLNSTIGASNDAAAGILTTIEEQLEGVSRVNAALQSLDNVATQNQASSRMAENVSQNLSKLSGELLESISQIKD